MIYLLWSRYSKTAARKREILGFGKGEKGAVEELQRGWQTVFAEWRDP